MSYKLITKDGSAKRGEFTTPHGVIQTPVFMNVGTAAAIKGAVSTEDLQTIGTQVELSNTYHLHVRPGDEVVKKLGGLHKFMVWDKPILTDRFGRISGVFSCWTQKDQRGRCNLPFARGWTSHIHGTGREHADSIESCIYDCNGI